MPDVEAVRLLLRHGAKAMARTGARDTPLLKICVSEAAGEEAAWVVVHRLVAAAPACLHSADRQRVTPLSAAVQDMQLGLARELLGRGARANERTEPLSLPPLHLAYYSAKAPQQDAAASATGQSSRAPKRHAEDDMLAMTHLLIAHGVDVYEVVRIGLKVD